MAKGVFGVCLTGAGARGVCVALVAASKAEVIAQDILERYKRCYASSTVLARLPTAIVLHVTV